MTMKLQLTGKATFSSPLTYGKGLALGQAALFRDADGAALLALSGVFTDKSADGSVTPVYDFTDDTNQYPVALDKSFTILPAFVAGYMPRIPRGTLLRDETGVPYGYSNGDGTYETLASSKRLRELNNLTGNVPVQIFTTAGLGQALTPPVGASRLRLALCSSGGGGGSGRRGAAATARSGGSPGSAGQVVILDLSYEDFAGMTLTLDIPAGGAGGAAVSVNDTNGNNGNPGAAIVLKRNGTAYLSIPGGLAGLGGAAANQAGAAAPLRLGNHPGAAQSTNVTATIGGITYDGYVGNGCAGGSIAADNTVYGHGWNNGMVNQTAVGNASGANGTSVRVSNHFHSQGGNGGAANAAANATAGGNGTRGSGGGGGGASLNGFNSGAGGQGGDGWAIALWS